MFTIKKKQRKKQKLRHHLKKTKQENETTCIMAIQHCMNYF